MSAQTGEALVGAVIGDILAEKIAADRLKGARQAAQLRRIQLASHDEIVVNGVTINCAYELHGRYYPATDSTPAEFPDIELVSISFDGRWLSDDDTGYWDDVLNVTERLGDMLVLA